jgi:rSAM/selenodomain-associated transferase 1
MTKRADTKILVFARAPEPGVAKTRLVPLLGKERAAALQGLMIERTLGQALAANVGPVDLLCTPDTDYPFFARCAHRFGVGLIAQSAGDLGKRMFIAANEGLAHGHRVLIIGTDCPALTTDDVRRAACALDDHDAVIIPAEDGGYVLIGLRRCHARVFADVRWSSDTVLAQTVANLAELGWRWLEMPASWDIDRPADYERLVTSRLIPDLAEKLASAIQARES